MKWETSIQVEVTSVTYKTQSTRSDKIGLRYQRGNQKWQTDKDNAIPKKKKRQIKEKSLKISKR